MAYETSAYTGLNDALDKLRIFVETLTGWATDSFADDSSKYAGDTWTGKRLHIHYGSMYFNFRSGRNQQLFQGSTVQTLGIAMYGSRGYSGSLTWDYQTGGILNSSSQSIGGHCNAMMEGGGTYYFFTDTDETVVTAMFQSAYTGVYTKMSFGALSNGWQFFASNDLNTSLSYLFTHVTATGQANSQYSKAAFNPSLSLWTSGLDDGSPDTNTLVSPLSSDADADAALRYATKAVTYSANSLTGNPVITPCHFTWFNNSSKYQYLGYVPDLFLTSMKYYDNAEEVTMPNSDVYVMFNNNYSDTSFGSSPNKGGGVAIKKVV